MSKRFMEPEEAMKRRLDRLGLEGQDVYDVLGYLVREHGLASVAGHLKDYLSDQAEQAFNRVEGNGADDFNPAKALADARGKDVCAAMTEALADYAERYEL